MAEVFKSLFMIKQRCFFKNSKKNIFNDMHMSLKVCLKDRHLRAALGRHAATVYLLVWTSFGKGFKGQN